MIDELIKIFDRDLDRLKSEILAFKHEENLWKTTGTINNPAGNLCMHLTGNLNTYIGKNLGQTGYNRDRPAEFQSNNIPVKTLIKQVNEVKEVITITLSNLQPEELDKSYPDNFLGFEMTTGYLLVHLMTHLSYHLGQINYIRRVLE